MTGHARLFPLSMRTLARWIGRLLMLLALGFVIQGLYRNWTAIAEWDPTGFEIAAILVLAFAYGAALVLLAENWHLIVSLFGPEKRTQTYRSYIRAHVAKYLPGNVAHLIGRGLILRGGLLSDRQLVTATGIELATAPAAALVCLVCLGASGGMAFILPGASSALWQVALVVGLLGCLAGAYTLSRFWRVTRQNLLVFVRMTALSTAFMAALGVQFAVLFKMLSPAPTGPLMAAAILAWLLGFLTPGAPGGIGTREAALVLFMSELGTPGSVLISAALLRIVTTVGDLLFFGAGQILLPSGKERPSALRP